MLVSEGAEHSHEVAIKLSKIIEELCDDCLVATVVCLLDEIDARTARIAANRGNVQLAFEYEV